MNIRVPGEVVVVAVAVAVVVLVSGQTEREKREEHVLPDLVLLVQAVQVVHGDDEHALVRLTDGHHFEGLPSGVHRWLLLDALHIVSPD